MARFNGIPVDPDEIAVAPTQGGRFGGVPVEQPEQDDGFSFGEMAGNFPSSLAKVVTDTARAVVHPKETLTALGGVIESGVEKLNPFASEEDYQYKAQGDAFVSAINERYGSWDNFLKTLEKDPAGVMADASALITGTGAATRMPKVAQFGASVDPLNMAMKLRHLPKMAVKGSVHAFPNMPAGTYRSAAKFNPSLGHKKHAELSQTALEYNIMPTGRGIDKLSALKNGFATEVNQMISAAQDAGAKIPIDAVFTKLGQLRKDLGGLKVGSRKNLDKIDEIAGDFARDARSQGRTHFTPKELQEFKIDLYNQINWNPASAKRTPTLTKKAIARGAKEGIEKLHPEIKGKNKELGRLLELEGALEPPATRIANRDLVGIGVPIKMGMGAATGNPAATAAATISAISDIPQWKALAAIKMHNLYNQGLLDVWGRSNVPWTLGRQGLLYGGRAQQLEEH